MLGRSLTAALAVAPLAFTIACASTPTTGGTVETDGPMTNTTATSTSPAEALTGSGAPVATGPDPAMTATGPKAPDFTLPSVDGGQISLSDYAGKKVVLI